MATILSEKAKERSTFAITAAPTDSDGAAVTPTTMAWKLTDIAGNVINGRSSVSLTPSTSMSIVLHGADLALTATGNRRIVTMMGTYTSSLGVGLELNDAVIFSIEPLVGIAD